MQRCYDEICRLMATGTEICRSLSFGHEPRRERERVRRTSSRWCAAKIKHRQTFDNKMVVVRCESISFRVFPWTKASSAHSIAYTVKCQWIIESQQQQQRQLMMRENKLDSLYARCECDVMAHCTTVAITFNFGMETETFGMLASSVARSVQQQRWKFILRLI